MHLRAFHCVAYDLDSDQVDDLEVAGDLAGNLWRFDLRDTTPSNLKVNLMFQTYSSTADVGKHPITGMPMGMRDDDNKAPILVFGTGKYLGACDDTLSRKVRNAGPIQIARRKHFTACGFCTAQRPIRSSPPT